MYFLELSDKKEYIPILPWGSNEPHGELLPYDTDTILATAVANGVCANVNEMMDEQKIEKEIVVLPSVWLGSQNVSQVDNYPFCIHFNTETQKAVLDDIIVSIKRQNINKLFIINGHNGNAMKGIIRDLMVKHDGFSIYLCNYLDIIDDTKKRQIFKNVVAYTLDEHAGYTEASLMSYVSSSKVNENIGLLSPNPGEQRTGGVWWSPSDWIKRSVNTRVGYIGNFNPKSGEEMYNRVVEQLSSDFIEIINCTNDKC